MLAMPAQRADSSIHSSMRWPMPARRCEGRTASSTRCARSSPNSMMAKPLTAPRAAAAPDFASQATTASVSRSRIARITRDASYFHPSPASMKSRDISAIAAASAELARQWQRNAAYPKETIGRMMEPVVAAYPPEQSVGATIEKLRELVKTTFITYVYVVDASEHLLGIVTMRDLLFSDHGSTLRNVMLRDPFALQANLPTMDAMELVLDRHYPVYPVIDAEKRL